MSEQGKKPDQGKRPEAASREARLKQALRDNLKRRRAQTRGRDTAAAAAGLDEAAGPPHDSAGIAPDKPGG